jgi:hypothetical protein
MRDGVTFQDFTRIGHRLGPSGLDHIYGGLLLGTWSEARNEITCRASPRVGPSPTTSLAHTLILFHRSRWTQRMMRLPFKSDVTAEHDGGHRALEVYIVVRGLSWEGLVARGHASTHGWSGVDIILKGKRL